MRGGHAAIADIARRLSCLSDRGPCLVAIDGRSGTGKSTFAAALAAVAEAVVVEGDDFFAGGTELRRDSPRERAADCIDWRRLRRVLEQLKDGRSVSYRPFDWEAFDGTLAKATRRKEPSAVIVIDGVYSARRELSDLMTLRVLLRTTPEIRVRRLLAREGVIGAWERQWHEAEDWYFANEAIEQAFDIVVDT